jgi:rubrerythrin
MFSIEDVIQIATTIEKNGEQTYREAARAVGRPDLSSLLVWMADQEQEHLRWFTKIGARIGSAEPSPELAEHGRSMLQKIVGDTRFSLADVDLGEAKSLAAILDAAIELELDTVIFYQMLAAFVTGEDDLSHLEKIIEEEKRHGRELTEYLEGLQ